ncbi:MAG TPA: hypothetical protein VH479_21755 [Acidimicrobiales bacterium]|jgi:hypothetical protein
MAEIPTQVAAVPGAAVVLFPWAGAGAAVAALERAAATLGSQLDTRGDKLADIADWAGTYRDEFDGALGRVGGVAGGLRDRLTLLASAIVVAAESANEQQALNNRCADLS